MRLQDADADSEGVQKAQLGCMDCLALLARVQVEADTKAAAAAATPAARAEPRMAPYPGTLAAQDATAAERAGPGGALYSGTLITEAEELDEPERDGGRAGQPRGRRLVLDELVEGAAATG